MREYQVEVVTELDEVETFTIEAFSPQEAEQIATQIVENGETYLYGRMVISAQAQ